MMEEKKLIPAPIDNKNVLEDFTDDFHGGNYVEHVEGRVHYQTFWCKGTLCMLAYEFGSNWFALEFLRTDKSGARKAAAELAGVMLALRENLLIKDGPGGVYLLYFKPEDCE